MGEGEGEEDAKFAAVDKGAAEEELALAYGGVCAVCGRVRACVHGPGARCACLHVPVFMVTGW